MRRTHEMVRVLVRVLAYIYAHPANKHRRFCSLVRAAAFQFRGRVLGRPTIVRVGRRMQMEVPLHATGGSKAVYANPPDWHEMQAWRLLLHPGDLFVDVGSNVGLYSLWAADCGATPIAIEPDPRNADRTRDNLLRNHLEGEIHQCALADKSGTTRFTTGMDTMNHLVAQDNGAGSHPVAVRTLDEILAGRHARGAKVDVEGAERLVLDGGQETLRTQRVDVLQLEWNLQSVAQLGEDRSVVAEMLRDYGYILCEPDPNSFSLKPIEDPDPRDADVFAVAPAFFRTLR